MTHKEELSILSKASRIIEKYGEKRIMYDDFDTALAVISEMSDHIRERMKNEIVND